MRAHEILESNILEMTNVSSTVITAFDRLWKNLTKVNANMPCKHYLATFVLQEMESIGIGLPKEIITAIAGTHDDEIALSWVRQDNNKIATVFDNIWRKIINVNNPSYSTENAIGDVLSAMITLGIAPPDDIILAALARDTEKVLGWER